jgi:hypothetical protein
MKIRQGWYTSYTITFTAYLDRVSPWVEEYMGPSWWSLHWLQNCPFLLVSNNVAHLINASWCGWKIDSWSDCCFTGRRNMTSLTLLIIRLQTTTLQEKVGHSYYYIQFNSHAHPFTYYPSQKQQNMSPNKLKCKKQQKKNYHTLQIL